jgi:biofilm protein TabA
MIYDTLDNAGIYFQLHPLFKDAFEFLRKLDHNAYKENTKITLIENRLRAGIDFYSTVSADQKKWEAHQNYIDIQCVFLGSEKTGYAPRKNLDISEPYNPGKDVLFLKENQSSGAFFADLIPGRFAVFFPDDAHKPGIHIAPGESSAVIKVVVKILIQDSIVQ